MIRSVRLVCAECGSEFVPEGGVLYYKDNYINNTVKEAKFICPACIKKWHEKWQIKNGFTKIWTARLWTAMWLPVWIFRRRRRKNCMSFTTNGI